MSQLAGLCLIVCVAGCHKTETTSTVPATTGTVSSPAATTAPTTAAAPSEPDEPFPDAGRCRLGRHSLAMAPLGGRCDAGTCAQAGGECAWGGFGCDTVCARRTRDGGKKCHDNRECEAGCAAPDDVAKGEHTDGKCRTNLVWFGCSNLVMAGVAQGTTCAD